MTKHQLRIGNKVKVFGKIYTIKELGEFEAAMEETHGVFVYSDMQGVELTGEVLLACGFKKDRNGWHMPGTRFSLTDKFYPCWLDHMLWPQDIPDFKHLSLKYVHQLQNLFYFLSGGIELTVNIEQVKV